MAVNPLLAKVMSTGNPIIEGRKATIVWRGKTAPLLVNDFHNWEDGPQKMEPLGKNLWVFSMLLSQYAYMEYAFLDSKSGERITDPFNPKRIWNGVNSYNHFFYMPSATPTHLIYPNEGIPRGIISRHKVPTGEFIVGSTRTVYLYQPPVNGPVPLVVVYDGVDYLKRANLNVIVDNMIAGGRIRPFAMAMIQNGGSARSVEYVCSDSTLGFIIEHLLPLAKQNLKLSSPAESPYGVLGASLGGLMALYTGLRASQIFGKVLSQSGAFLVPGHEFVVVDLVRYAPRPKIEIWMDVGRYEGLLDGNHKMVGFLKEKNYNVAYHEFYGGHNYTAWKNDIWRGLVSLFPA